MIKSEHTSYTDLLRLKSALEQVLGAEEWYRLKDNRSLATWKSSLQKALRMTAAAIEGTVAIADEDWLSRSKEILCQGKQDISKSHSIGDVIGSFAACYMLLSFNQIGFAPDRKGSTVSVCAVPSKWKLDAYRTVQYVQCAEQKLAVEFCKDKRPFKEKVLDVKYSALK